MLDRQDLFARLRALKPDGRFSTDDVKVIDGIADELMMARVTPVTPAPATEIPADYWPTLSKIESGDRPYIKASTSSASGLYQFIKDTWIGEGGQWGSNPAMAFGGLTPSIEEQTRRAKSFTEKNAAVLRKNSVAINKASLYAAHFLGVGTAVKVLSQPDSARADVLAGSAATKANPSILSGKTVGEFRGWLRRKTGDTA